MTDADSCAIRYYDLYDSMTDDGLLFSFAPVVFPDVVVLGSALDEGGTSGIFIIEGGTRCGEGTGDG